VAGVHRLGAGGYTNRYRKELRYQFGPFNDKGLGLINANRLDLEKVYVDLAIDADPALSRSAAALVRRDFRDARPVWDFLNQARPGATLAVTGPPGSGKTTLIQHLLLVHARNRQRCFRARARLPFFVEIRRLPELLGPDALRRLGLVADPATANLADLPALAVLLDRLIPKQYRDFPAPPPGWTARRLATGRALLLFDGLDEVADPDTRRGLVCWLQAQLTAPATRHCLGIVTSRPQGYRDAPLSRALVLVVQPFTSEQVRRFVGRWYRANEIVSAGKGDTPEVRRRAGDGAQDLLERLRNTPRLNELTSNPLLLTMVCMVHRYHGALPGSRAQLYEEICQVLLERWRQGRGIADNLRAAQKLLALRPLAARMMDLGAKEIGRAEALQVMLPHLEQLPLTPAERAGFLERLQTDSGLLLEREPGCWSFAHLSFQEYLSGAHWRESGPPAFTAEQVTASWWREVLLLYAAQADASGIVEAALAEDSVVALGLAYDLSREARNIAPTTRAKLDELLESALADPASPRFPIAAEVWLLRNYQHAFTVLPNGLEISPPVSQAEYQLFVQEGLQVSEGQAGIQRMPLHWFQSYFQGAYDQPLLGTMPWQVKDFLDWLDQRFPDYAHRLPSAEELKSLQLAETSMLWWSNGPNGIALVGEPLDAIRRTRLDCGTVRFSIDPRLDLARWRMRARARASILNFAIKLDLGLDLAFYPDLARLHAFQFSNVRACTLDLARALDLDFYNLLDSKEKITSCLECLEEVGQQRRPSTTSPTQQNRYRLLEASLLYLLGLLDESPCRQRSAARNWLIACLEIATEVPAVQLWRRHWNTLWHWLLLPEPPDEQEPAPLLAFLQEIAARERGESQPC